MEPRLTALQQKAFRLRVRSRVAERHLGVDAKFAPSPLSCHVLSVGACLGSVDQQLPWLKGSRERFWGASFCQVESECRSLANLVVCRCDVIQAFHAPVFAEQVKSCGNEESRGEKTDQVCTDGRVTVLENLFLCRTLISSQFPTNSPATTALSRCFVRLACHCISERQPIDFGIRCCCDSSRVYTRDFRSARTTSRELPMGSEITPTLVAVVVGVTF